MGLWILHAIHDRVYMLYKSFQNTKRDSEESLLTSVKMFPSLSILEITIKI